MSSGSVLGRIVDKEKKSEVQWIISPDKLLGTWQEDEYLQSPPFHCFRSSWCFRFYPNERGSFVSLVRDNITNEEFPLTLCVRIVIDYKQNVYEVEPKLCTFYQDYRIYEILWDSFSSVDENPLILQPRRILKTNTTIKCSVTEKYPQTMDMSSFCTRQFSDDFKKLWKTPRGWDITIEVSETGETYRAHKLILKARSPELDDMLTRKMNENEVHVLSFIGYGHKPVLYFLTFLYTGKLKSCDSYSSAKCLYNMAYQFKMEDLKIRSRQLIEQEIYTDTVCDILNLAQLRTDSQLLESAKRFATSNLLRIDRKQWAKFRVENKSLAAEILKDGSTSSYTLRKRQS